MHLEQAVKLWVKRTPAAGHLLTARFHWSYQLLMFTPL